MLAPIEYKSTQEIRDFQEEKLQELLTYLAENSPYYQNVFSKHSIAISSIKTIADLSKLPFTTKEDVQAHNDDFLCVAKTKIVDYVTTSGTTGDPVFFGLTDNDLERLAYNEALSFACSQVTENDVIQLTTTIDRRFMAGIAYFLGARKLGAGIIRVGSGIPELQWDSILKFKPTYLIAVPSFVLKLIQFAEKNNIDFQNSSLKNIICIGEPLRNSDFTPNILANKITENWEVKLFSTYASTEMSTTFAECEFQNGGHHHPELIITEILDENNQAVAENEAGELVVTTLGIEGMPLLRYRTGDIVQSFSESCKCGRNSMRLGPIIGRKKQMIKYKGTSLFPPALCNLLNDFDEIVNYVIVIETNDIETDHITLKIGVKEESELLLNQIKDRFRAKIRVTPSIEYHSIEAIESLRFQNQSRKPVFFIDHRKTTL